MDLIKTESVFNLDALTEGKAYRVTVLSEGCEKGRKRDMLLSYKKKDILTFYFINPETGLPITFKYTPYDIEHKRYKVEPLDAEADRSKSMLEAAKSMRDLCGKTAACDGCALCNSCSAYLRVRPMYWAL